ncbi:hypothetical protein BGZ51_003624 [Haplosporangium sp. Z 767]|nr:hypothetical protein BGZ51_003624 [Haplosporangium sp. Z 767]KAF9195935.1 hypothetical protein BGZ50_002964 [Haplosporangium sp. Z 11]
MAGPSRSSSVSLYKDQAQSPSPSLPDEGYDEQRLDIPKWVQHWTDEQRAELAIQLLKSVSPSVFSRSYARLMPLFEYRDFLVLLPYELTVHLLSFLDAQTLANVALVSKAWNKFASDNTVWKTIYFKQGWTVNQDMVDWYLRSAEQEYQWALKHTELETTDGHHGSECSVSHGKRKMEDCDMREAVGRDYSEDYEMMQELHGDRAMYSPRLLNDDEKTLDTYLANSTPFGHSDDIDMARSPGDEYDGGSSPISIPASSPVSRNPSASPEHSPIRQSTANASDTRAAERHFAFHCSITKSAIQVFWSSKSKLYGSSALNISTNIPCHGCIARLAK